MTSTRVVLAACFLLSGAAGLLFETLWFRTLGLALGNSVWASALVLAAFMGGLALGNAVAAWKGAAVARPIRAYALLELGIAGVGLVLVLALPALGSLMGPALRPWLDTPAVLNPVRGLVALVLLVVPCTAMGAGLPLVVKALASRDHEFGRDLGMLYGLNTLGAVVGAVSGEALLIHHLGVRGTAAAAAGLDVVAAAGALWLSRRVETSLADEPAGAPVALDAGARRLLAAAFVAGGLLLALEVAWFRFLQLFVQGTAVALAVMLAAVLCGISAGSFAAAALLRRVREATHAGAAVALLGGAATLWTYAGFPYGGSFVLEPDLTARFALRLVLVPCFLSGALFTVLGAALRERVPGDARAAGLLTLANTTGAALGALLGGFALLPRLGVERTILLLGAAYAVVGLLAFPPPRARSRAVVLAGTAALAAFLALVLLFPSGLMQNHFLAKAARRYTADGSRVVAVREGLTETITYLRQDVWGRPHAWRLLTNGYSMSGSAPSHRRYMKLFVYWPMMLRPQARRALLISYGVGSTARALTDTASLERIDVVDISRDVLEMSRLVFPDGGWPLADPRVRVHLEDGRFFLQATGERWDLVTSEPPPPKNAGITNLYSRQYFVLMRDRLVEGGVATHWLPVEQLTVADSRAIVRAFCDAFPDCTLWNGSGWDWMLAGTRGAPGPADEDSFTRQWREPRALPELHGLGLGTPELLGATFLGDTRDLGEFAAGEDPLTDERPGRLSLHIPQAPDPAYAAMARADGARERFARSEFVRRHWPPALRERTLEAFRFQRARTGERLAWRDVMEMDERGAPPAVLLQALGSSVDEQRLVELALEDGRRDPPLLFRAGLGAIAARDPRAADRLFAAGQAQLADADPARRMFERHRLVALCLARDVEAARAVASADEVGAPADVRAWLKESCGL